MCFIKNSSIYHTIIGFIALLLLCVNSIAETNITIKISPQYKKSNIDKKVFGTSILGWEIDHGRQKKNNKIGSDYCYGIWDGKHNEYAIEPLKLAKNIKIGSIRLIGQFTDWEKGVEEFGKNEYAFGLNEQLKFSQDIDAEPIICLQNLELTESYIKLFEYLKKNHPRVKYVEIGNESYQIIPPEEYAKKYLFYYDMIKNVNPNILIGFVGRDVTWERRVLAIIRNRFDFVIEHYYPHGGRNKDPWQVGNKVFSDLFPKAAAIEVNILNTLNIMDAVIGERKPIAVTEYNAWFVQDRPVPYRHALGTALINAELLRIFMKPENNILMANYWNFANEYWGMIANGFDGRYETLNNPYYKRPNYYVFEMYHKHFGDILIDVDVQCDTYDAGVYQPIKSFIKRIKTGTLIKSNLIQGRWLIEEFSGAQASENAGILTIDFVDPIQFNYYHARKTTEIEPGAYYKLSGYIKTEDLIDENGVCLEAQDARGWDQTKSSASTEKIKGTTDWQYVETIYETLPDAKVVNVIARRSGEKGPLKGRAYFKEVKLEKFIPSLDAKVPYLSVNASKSADGKIVYLMVINKNMDEPITAGIELKDFAPAAKGNAWVLNGPSVDATNEQKHDNVKVTEKEFEIKGNPFEFTFEPHSLTAIEIREKYEN